LNHADGLLGFAASNAFMDKPEIDPGARPVASHFPPPRPETWKQSRFGFATFFFLSLLVAQSGLRLGLFLAFRPRGDVRLAEEALAFLVGWQGDALVALLVTALLLLWWLLLPQRQFEARWHRRLFLTGLFLFWWLELFLLCAEYFFFEEFQSRFNTVAVDYLVYPHEVFINLWAAYPVGKVVLGCAALAAGWVWLAVKRWPRWWAIAVSRRSRLGHFAGAVALGVGLALTVNFKGTRFSSQRVLNEIANNGTLAFVSAALTRHLDYAAFYKTMPREEAYRRARHLLSQSGVEFSSETNSIQRRVPGDPALPRRNVVLLLEESFGSEFWGSLGRAEPTLTPEMDKLANEEGLLFTHLYASGNRTVRGLEGVLSSFPPLPGDSIVKRDQSANVATIARVLKHDGYSTAFLYGGRGVFDGMRAFALRNGYDRFIEEKHFAKPTFSTMWGVCDEDLFARAIEECRALAQTGRPFFVTTLSVSNHKPYTYPPGRIPEDPEKKKRRHAVKYSDYALGQFFKAAKQEAFWTNTIFAVVADHGARVYGSQSIPIQSYEIPLLIAGPTVVTAPSRVPRVGCSLDVAPTLLGLIGRPFDNVFFGRDLLAAGPEPGRVLIQHNRDIGLFTRQRLVVLGLMQNVEFYEGDPQLTELTRLAQPGSGERELENDAIALFQVADDLYVHGRYRLPY